MAVVAQSSEALNSLFTLWSPYGGFPVGRKGEWAATAVGYQSYQGLMNVSCSTLYPINARAVYLPPILLYTR